MTKTEFTYESPTVSVKEILTDGLLCVSVLKVPFAIEEWKEDTPGTFW